MNKNQITNKNVVAKNISNFTAQFFDNEINHI